MACATIGRCRAWNTRRAGLLGDCLGRGCDEPRFAQELAAAIQHFPPLRPRGMSSGQAHPDGDSMDLVVGEVAETLRHMSNEASLLRYLRALAALKGSAMLARTRRITRIRLQVRCLVVLGACLLDCSQRGHLH